MRLALPPRAGRRVAGRRVAGRRAAGRLEGGDVGEVEARDEIAPEPRGHATAPGQGAEGPRVAEGDLQVAEPRRAALQG